MAVSASDVQIRQDVIDALTHDVRIDATQVDVDVTSGTVRLSGPVPTYVQKITAGHLVRRIKGVRSLVNDLVVAPSGAQADQAIAQIVREHLERDVRISNPSQIHVAVANGVVTLTGTTATPAERAAAADDARTGPGVIEVVNNLAVVPAVVRRDAEIAADVREGLERNPLVDPSKIAVNVVDGTVFLRGTVATSYEAQCAVREAWCVPGVRNVVDELIITF